MPPELRKRKAPAAEPATAPPAKKKGPIAKAATKVKEVVAPKPKVETKNGTTSASASTGRVAVGETIDLEGFGGEVEMNDGVKTTLKKLVEGSKSGVVLFTYPKASTPGCTTQVCLFRDSYTPLTSTGFAIYGLSKDSPKANTTFKEKQKLPYPLLCDPSSTLIAAIGLKKASASTTRGVFVVDKSGKILAAEPGGPAATVAVVKKLMATNETAATPAKEPQVEEPKVEAPVANGTTSVTAKEDVAEEAGKVDDAADKLDDEETKEAKEAEI